MALVALALAAAASSTVAGRTNRAGDTRIIVTRTGPLPRTCAGPRGVAQLVVRFAQAFNRGDRRRLSRFFDYYLQTYSVSAETTAGWTAVRFSRKQPLLRYFRRRHAHAETLSPAVVSASRFGPGLPTAASIGFWFTRRADDLAATQPLAYGKGIVDCRRKTIVIFNMAMPKDPPAPPPYWPTLVVGCPKPPDWDPSQGVIACVN